tara:strand:- start:112 stop:948 length:837 start_codon:yes stop_codon:yes gene_type:complete
VPNHFIYPISDGSGRYFANDKSIGYKSFEKMAQKGEKSDWRLGTNFHSIKSMDWIWVYYTLPHQQLKAVGRVTDGPYEHPDWNEWAIEITWDSKLTKKLLTKPIDRKLNFDTQSVRAAAEKANSKTLKTLNRWLKGYQSKTSSRAAEEVGFRIAEVKARQGQATFRRELLKFYGGECVVTGCTDEQVLHAAHIRSVKDGGKHANWNGLLLRSDIHQLFDLGLVTIDENFVVCVGDNVSTTYYKDLQGKRLADLKRRDSEMKGKIKSSLSHHRKLFNHR